MTLHVCIWLSPRSIMVLCAGASVQWFQPATLKHTTLLSSAVCSEVAVDSSSGQRQLLLHEHIALSQVMRELVHAPCAAWPVCKSGLCLRAGCSHDYGTQYRTQGLCCVLTLFTCTLLCSALCHAGTLCCSCCCLHAHAVLRPVS